MLYSEVEIEVRLFAIGDGDCNNWIGFVLYLVVGDWRV